MIVIQAVPVAWADKAFLASEPDLYACIEVVAARHARDGRTELRASLSIGNLTTDTLEFIQTILLLYYAFVMDFGV